MIHCDLNLTLPVFTSPAFPGNIKNWRCISTYHYLFGEQIHFPLLGFQSRHLKSREGETGITIPRTQPACYLQQRPAAPTQWFTAGPPRFFDLLLFPPLPPLWTPNWTLLIQCLLFLVQELGVNEPVSWPLSHLISLGVPFLFCKMRNLDQTCVPALALKT